MPEKKVEQDIIAAAIQVFIEKGKDGARMQEIADRAGVNKMLLHYYYKDKDTLFIEVVRQVIADLYGQVIEESMNALTFHDFLATFIERHFVFLDERKAALQFLLWELSRYRFDLHEITFGTGNENGKNPFQLVFAKLQAAIANGEVRAVDPAEFTFNLFSLDLSVFVFAPAINSILSVDHNVLHEHITKRQQEIFRLLWADIKIT